MKKRGKMNVKNKKAFEKNKKYHEDIFYNDTIETNKKGLEMIWSTWVIIVLSVLLLAFLILFFTNYSTSFLDNVKNYFSKSNVDSVVKGCNILVSTESRYEFCCDTKKVTYISDGDKRDGMFTCYNLTTQSFTNNDIINNKIDCNNNKCG